MSDCPRRVPAVFAMAVCFMAADRSVALDDSPSGRTIILNEAAYLRQYYRFGPDRVSPALLRSEGQSILGPAAWRKLQTGTEARLRRLGLDPQAVAWQDHVFVRLFFDAPNEHVSSPPPADWTAEAFQDGDWVLDAGPILAASAERRTLPKGLGWTKENLDQADFDTLGIRSCHYRARFTVGDPAAVEGMTLALTFRGGARVWLNGRELARAFLPAGDLPADAPGEDYPAAAYRDRPELRDRTLGPVSVPAGLLRRGVNLLAVEVRASELHPITLGMNLPRQNHKVRQGMEGLWPHAQLARLELSVRSGPVTPALARPAGPQVWAVDPHHRVESTEFLPGGQTPGTVRFAAARNGTFSGQIVVAAGAAGPLTGLQVRFGPLARDGGAERLDAPACRVLFPAPYPVAEFSEKRLGDERGLGATFPDSNALRAFETMADAKTVCLFDHLTPRPASGIPAGACRPAWLSLRVPAGAAPGTYRGRVQVTADGMPPAEVPVEAEVFDWRLPDPADFATFVGCEQNPYAVARQYAVKPWSDEHFTLLAASFRQLARVGDRWLNVPVIRRTEFGNDEDSMIRWIRRRDGSLAFDYAVLDRYLDLAAKLCGPPKVVNFVVMQGMPSAAIPPAPPTVNVLDEATGRSSVVALGGSSVIQEQRRRLWGGFARSLVEHMKARRQAGAMYWGYPCDQEDDRDLKVLLAELAPAVYWAADPHELLWNAVYAKDARYRAIVTVRYQPGPQRAFGLFRTDRGWSSKLLHLLNPRVGGNFFTLHTVSYPFAYRLLPELAVARGHSGIGRIGADDWAATHYSNMDMAKWIVGMPVLFTLWPGPAGAESSVRFEALIEGVQEAEARIFLERALDSGRLASQPAAARIARLLDRRLDESGFFPANLCVHELEKCTCGWQQRSRELFEAAAGADRSQARS